MTGTLYSIMESPGQPDFSALYEALGYAVHRPVSQRKAIGLLKSDPPDVVVAEFFYGYGNNYAGVNISNLDVFLHSLRKYAPAARVILLVAPHETAFAHRLAGLFPIHRLLTTPPDAADMRAALTARD